MKKIYIEKSTGIIGIDVNKARANGTKAVAVKGYKHKTLKTWDEIGEYQRRGWEITLVAR